MDLNEILSVCQQGGTKLQTWDNGKQCIGDIDAVTSDEKNITFILSNCQKRLYQRTDNSWVDIQPYAISVPIETRFKKDELKRINFNLQNKSLATIYTSDLDPTKAPQPTTK